MQAAPHATVFTLPAGLGPERESYGCSQPPDGGTFIIRDDIAVAQAILPSMTA